MLRSLTISIMALMPTLVLGQTNVTPDDLSHPPSGAWETYHGDSSGDHFSSLSEISTRTVDRLGLAWAIRPITTGAGIVESGPSEAGPTRASHAPAFPSQLKATPLVSNGVIYMVVGSQVQALDARTGHTIWRYHWVSSAGTGLGRGVALYHDSVIVQTGMDNHVVSLDSRTGTERWQHQVTDSPLGYAGSTAPIIAGEHLILGMGGDGNNLATWLESRDPATGSLQWRWYVTPRAGESGMDSWPDPQAAAHGGGMPWQQVTYDPKLDLIYVPTANPVPAFNGRVRAGNNLYTDSIVALHAATGKMAWFFQATANDTHDYDATQVLLLFDAPFDGKPQHLLAQVNRNGYYYLLDRETGLSLITRPFIDSVNWTQGIGSDGRPISNPAKDPQPGGTLLSPMSDGAANYPAPSFDPKTRLIYSHATKSFSLFYLNPEEEHPIGWGGGSEYHTGYSTSALLALDYASGRIVWRHDYPDMGFLSSAYPGMLSTAGGLIFTGDPAGNFIAFDAKDGHVRWHSGIGKVRNSPITYLLDNHQYVLVATDDCFYAFALNRN